MARRLIWIGIALLCAAVNPVVPPPPARVIVISLDGARPDAIRQAQTPNMQRLAADGASSWNAQTVFPPATLPAHASLLTGLDVDEHGIAWNDYSGIDEIRRALTLHPTFLDIVAEAGWRVAMVIGKQKLDQFYNPASVGTQHAASLQLSRSDFVFAFMREGDRSVIDETIRLLDDGYEILFVHLPNPDYFGHLAGWMSDGYLYELRNTDAQIGRLLAALDEHGIREQTLIVITADHGGHGTVHGADIPEDMTIPLILSGYGVCAGIVLEGEPRITQITPTVLWMLGLPLRDGMDDPLAAAFCEPLSSVRRQPAGAPDDQTSD